MKLKLSSTIKLCWCIQLTNFKSIAFANLKLRIVKVVNMDVCGKIPFRKSKHILECIHGD